MANLSITQRLWQITDGTVQRALESIANTIDAGFKRINTSLDFTDATLTVRNSLSVLGSTTAQAINAATVAATATPGFTSASGFKTYVGMWAYAGMTTAASNVQMTFGCWGTTTFTGASVPAGFGGWVAPYPGSILAVTGRCDAGAIKNMTLTVYINNVATTQTTTIAAPASGNASFNATFAKGAYPFAAGDVVDIRVGASSTTGMDMVVAELIAEMGA